MASVPPLRVLIVDDHIDTAASLNLLLRFWDHETATARDGPEALVVAAGFRPDVVLLDIGLPRMDGCEVARRMRELPGLGSVVLVAMTGFTDEGHRRQSDASGFAFYIVKPADPDMLQMLLGAIALGKGKKDTV
jgi:CheY-like chemotaxis protein